jgi:hypothetical protein
MPIAHLLIRTDLDFNVTPIRVFLNPGEVDFIKSILAADPTTTLSFVELPVGLEVTVID